MPDITVTISGEILELMDNIDDTIKTIMEDCKTSIRAMILEEIDRSVFLSAIIGRSPDPEALRAIIRGIKVEVTPSIPPGIEVKYQDDLAHWYGGAIPDELLDILEGIINSTIDRWESSDALDHVLDRLGD